MMEDSYAGMVALIRDGVVDSVVAGEYVAYPNYPTEIAREDVDALIVYEQLLRHHKHNRAAVHNNISNLLVWLPLAFAMPGTMKPVETPLFGGYDTNLSTVQFLHFVEEHLGKALNGVDLYQLVRIMDYWSTNLLRWMGGALIVIDREETSDEEE